ncbi:Uncharacterised protein [Bifidobacterium longum subsp. infantis]|uniref:Transposase n=1 Tax=Bifidobacterium longum subsp. infantis TaxID=1682 RepID=A0ABP1X685_BIFLI|nr:hypothetical protein BLIC_a00580 [Bifidobacterium longum subsp. infantis]CEE98294.1 hypothetical protein BLIC_b00580 [Bifidobacterium longum subsp. infantis]CEE99184.1 hypothetical protein BLIC_c00587 [Bifidobacterium longum subsp. infantis]CEF02538.1 hypothetical protein BLIC_e00583 [Bifidobacterium longum subsp. infantis]CEF05254.1 hypothetical protein BLIC_g00583 [Bifidobacterium longum subsp. infantis]
MSLKQIGILLEKPPELCEVYLVPTICPKCLPTKCKRFLRVFHPASFKVMLQPKTLSNLLHTCLQIALGLIVKTRPYSGGLFSII